ncbi:hypothetical protein ACHHYP_09231 [Achlya hypogyna]|uniref:Fido domain-containing protein n=1 Tax=Achlya hypogyna TaxID=1202772 RepID=A0A1V9YNM1_ACHHY|nr:hypothetical protein ACHHYP_09231 [Achlya hypogyna]
MAEVPPMVRDTTALCWAAGSGDTGLLQQLIAQGADVNLADYDQRTPLHVAASDGKAEIVEFLLKAGADVHKKDRWGVTPLQCAKDPLVVAVLAQFVRFQPDASARPPLRRRSPTYLADLMTAARDALDPSAVFAAVHAGDTETLKRAWLDGVGVDVTDAFGRTALHVAVEAEQLDVIELLLSAGAKSDVADAAGRTPMSLAVDANAANIVDVLRRRHHPPPPSFPLDDHRVPLAFEAVKRGDLAYLRRLVPAFVPPDVQDYDARSLLHVASSEGRAVMCQYLVECGADVNALDRWGSSPLAEAAYFAHHDVARYLRAHHAVEHGHSVDDTLSQMDVVVLDAALEHVLRVVCRARWVLGEACVPVKDADNDGCALVLHTVWCRTSPTAATRYLPVKNPRDKAPSTLPPALARAWSHHATGGSRLDPITLFRKARGLMLVDPGQDHVGRVYSGQQPEWLGDIGHTPQSKFFFAPHARKAGLLAVMSVPMVAKLAVVAVLSWYSPESVSEDAVEVQRIQRLVKAVTALCALKQEAPTALSRYQYCFALESALTGAGELLYESVTADECTSRLSWALINAALVAVHDVVSLALHWRLFDAIDKLATSMSSEDHAAALNLLSSLVGLLAKGAFDDVLSPALLELEAADLAPPVDSKARLVQRLVYYLAYWAAVSPTEGDLFSKVHHLHDQLQRHMHPQPAVAVDVAVPLPPVANEPECILCKFNVPGHIHRGQMPPPPVVTAPPPEAPVVPSLFCRVPSPVLRELESLPRLLAEEYDRFGHKAQLRQGEVTPFSTSDVFDALGSSHGRAGSFGPQAPAATAGVVATLNLILADSSCLVSHAQLIQLHRAVLEAANETGGVVRDHAAVGYASERIYRVFLPAEEIETALTRYVETLNTTAFGHPLVAAYYAFAALVFYIHPFYDGNGRTARLLGNLVARKSGFPGIFRHVDKTIQLTPFLETAVHTIEMQEAVRRARQGRLAKGNKTTSTWF